MNHMDIQGNRVSQSDDKTSNVVEKLLSDQSYDIEFNTFLSNHVKHAVVALEGLGASPERIKEYYDTYAECTPYGYGLEPPRSSEQTITQDNWRQFFGKLCSFGSYCRFFDQKEKELGMERLLGEYVPVLLPGCAGRLLHGTIHLGWALDAGNRWMIIEGLAYMAFSYLSCDPDRAFLDAHGADEAETVFGSLLRMADAWENDAEGLKAWHEATLTNEKYTAAAGFHPELAKTGTQYNIAKVLAEGHPLIHATPAWIENLDMASIWKELHEAVALIYMTAPGDFISLHLITSLHAMEKIAEHLPVDQQKFAVKCFWTAVLGVTFSRGKFPERATLEALHAQYKDAVDHEGKPVEGPEWERIVARAIREEEEHNPKLVYALRLQWERFGRRSLFRIAANHFTDTPQIPKFEDGIPLGADRPC